MKTGFTLVELAIVLVIIGLLVGGVLAGQELINQAKINKIVSEVKNIERAYTTFYLKYNGLPGDIRNPERFFTACNNSFSGGGDTYEGNGNGIIESGASMESECAWPHLVNSGLYYAKGPIETSAANETRNIKFEDGEKSQGMLWPHEESVSAYIFHDEGSGIKRKNNILEVGGNDISYLIPEDAFSLDSKIDDGKPGTGIIYAAEYFDNDCFTNNMTDPSYVDSPSANSEYSVTSLLKACDFSFDLKN